MALTQILTTKLYIPPSRPELVSRPRLMARLNDGLQHTPGITLVSAPAGFGKTTLISHWLSAKAEGGGMKAEKKNLHPSSLTLHPFESAWLSLDEDDNDPIRFFTYLVAALETVLPDIGSDVLALLQSPQPPPLKSSLTMLINNIATADAPRFVLVLDDYHLITQPEIHEALTFLLDHLPPQMHLVIAGRADPDLPLARLRTRSQLTELREADLRFTQDEAVAFLNAMGLKLSAENVTALENRTEGWIAGLQLAALSMRGRAAGNLSNFINAFSGSHRHVIDYLAEEVMAQQSGDTRAFLLQTSILESLTAPLCDAITRRDDSESILRQLEHDNLFLISLDDQRQWYRYHRLFADFLRSHLNEVLPDQLPDLHRRASHWYEQNGLADPAIDHALAAEDFERAVDLIEGVADEILMRSEVVTLQNWIEALPNEVARTRPRLGVYHAWALTLGGHPFEMVQARLHEAVRSADAGRFQSTAGAEATSITGEVAAFRAWVAALQGDMAQTEELSRQALELLPQDSLFMRGIVAASVGLVYMWQGNIQAATDAFSEVARISRETHNLIISTLATNRLGQLAMISGHLYQAERLFEQTRDLATDKQGRHRPIAGIALAGLGWLYYERNELEKAERYIQEGIELTTRWAEVGNLQPYIMLAVVKQSQGNVQGADEAIQMARHLAVKFDAMELDDFLVAAYQARLWVKQGNIRAAWRWAKERGLEQDENLQALEKGTQGAGSPLLRMLEYMSLVRLYVADRLFDKALTILEPLLQLSETAGWTLYHLEALIQQALVYYRQGDTPTAVSVMERVLVSAHPEGYRRIFVDEGPLMAELLQKMKAEGGGFVLSQAEGPVLSQVEGMNEYINELLMAFGNKEKIHPSSFHLHPLIDPLSDREIEVLQHIAEGMSNKEIARELIISPGTVKKHLNNIYTKLNVHSRTQALARAKELQVM